MALDGIIAEHVTLQSEETKLNKRRDAEYQMEQLYKQMIYGCGGDPSLLCFYHIVQCDWDILSLPVDILTLILRFAQPLQWKSIISLSLTCKLFGTILFDINDGFYHLHVQADMIPQLNDIAVEHVIYNIADVDNCSFVGRDVSLICSENYDQYYDYADMLKHIKCDNLYIDVTDTGHVLDVLYDLKNVLFETLHIIQTRDPIQDPIYMFNNPIITNNKRSLIVKVSYDQYKDAYKREFDGTESTISDISILDIDDDIVSTSSE